MSLSLLQSIGAAALLVAAWVIPRRNAGTRLRLDAALWIDLAPFAILAVLLSAALLLWLRRIDARARQLASGVALILGGAIGNLIDRLRLGHVVDFVSAHWGVHYFPAFNVADSAITVGAALLLLDAWLEAR